MNSDSRRDRLLLFAVALAVHLLVAVFITRPGYMDAAYYAAGAVNMAQGGGLNEPFIWNYLGEPSRIPHPGFLYWMPLPSILAAPFAALFPGSFFALQLPFVLLSSLLPCIAYTIARRTTGRRRTAWAAGLLMLFSGFFFPYWTLPETFAPFALLGSLSIWLAADSESEVSTLKLFLAGALTGLAHLTRADGVLLLPIVALAPLLSPEPSDTQRAIRNTSDASRFAFVILGYLLAMTPWFIRNLNAIGAPLSPAGTKTLWLTDYDDLFCYDCDLSLQNYLAWGWGNILRSKLFALWINLQRFLAENCLVFLFPFVAVGLYRLRRHLSFLLAGVYLLLLYLVHSLAFTFPGWRGGFFHSSSALLPFLYVAGLEGLDASLGWVARRRVSWNRRQARLVFTTAAVMGALALSVYAVVEKFPVWRRSDAVYGDVDRWLDERQVPPDARVMVNNPAGFWYHTRRSAVVVPNEDVKTLLAACDRYGVEHLILDANHPSPLHLLYEKKEVPTRLLLARTFDEGRVIIWEVKR